MVRVILGLMLIAALAMAIAAVASMVRSLSAPPEPARQGGTTKDDPMPDTLRNIAYVLLLILLFGIATGILGA